MAEQSSKTRHRVCLAGIWAVLLLRTCLKGPQLTIWLDLVTPWRILNFTGATRNLSRWPLRLSEFDFEIGNRAGVKNEAADKLSCLPTTGIDQYTYPHAWWQCTGTKDNWRAAREWKSGTDTEVWHSIPYSDGRETINPAFLRVYTCQTQQSVKKSSQQRFCDCSVDLRVKYGNLHHCRQAGIRLFVWSGDTGQDSGNRWLYIELRTGIFRPRGTVNVALPRSSWSSRWETVLRFFATRLLLATYCQWCI